MKKTNKSKKSLSIFVLAVITLAFFAACTNPLLPGPKKKNPVPERETDEILIVNITAAFDSEGRHVTLTADVTGNSGGTLSYQWYSNADNNNEEGTELPGETQASYKPPVDAVGTTYYYVKATNIFEGKIARASSNTIGILVHGNGLIEVIVVDVETPVVTIAVESAGGGVTLTAAASVSDGGILTYQWYKNTADRSDGGTAIAGETGAAYTPPVTPNGTVYYYVKATNTLNGQTASASSHTVRITIQDGKITEFIVSETVETPVVSVTAASSNWIVTLTATATVGDGGTLSYRWYKNTVDSGRGGTFIAGAIGTSYTPPVSVDETAYYYVKVTNTLKGQTADAVSNTVRVIVQSGAITEFVVSATVETPLVSVTAESEGANVTLTAAASVSGGGILSFQWYRNTVDNSKSGALIAGATGTTYTPPTDAVSTAYYYVKVTNTLNGQTADASSNTVRVIVQGGGITEVIISETVKTPVVSIVASLTGRIVTITATATVTDGGTITYQWYRNSVDNRNGTPIAGARGTTYTPPVGAGTTYYFVKATNTLKGQTADALSNIVGVIVREEGGPVEIVEVETPEVETPTVSVTGTVDGRVVTLTATARVTDGGALSYQWYSNSQNNKTNGEAIAGATEMTYSPSTEAVSTTYYYAEATNTLNGNTASATSNIVGVVVPEDGGLIEIIEAETPVITVITSLVGPYNIGSNVVITASASVTDGGTVTYQWYKNTANNKNGTEIAGGTGPMYAPPTETTGTTYYYCIATNTLKEQTASAVSNTVEITVVGREIRSAALSVTVPVKTAQANAQALTNESISYTPGNVAWSDSDGTAHTGSFEGGKVYIATVILTANTGYGFAANGFTATINGSSAVVSNLSAATVTVSFTFDATMDKTVTNITVTTQPTKMEYIYGEELDLAGMVIKVEYDSGTPNYDEGTLAELSASDKLGTNITANPANGDKLSIPIHSTKPVTIYAGGKNAATGSLTVNPKALTITGVSHTKVFDATNAAPNMIVTSFGGIENNDTVTATTITGVYTSVNAGTTTMNVSAATLTGQHASFYTLTLPANNVPITGGGITKATPTITKQPSNAEYTVNGTTTYYLRNTYTQALRNFSPSSAGVATGAGGAAVTGTWSWLAPDIVAGTYITRVGRQSTNTNTNLRMKFTPTGTYATNYNEVTFYPLLWLTVPASVIPVVSSGGTFNMTSVGSVTTVSFDINLYEVTNLLLSRVSTGSNVTAGRENYPATANWYRAIHFCNSLSLAQGYTPVYTINGSTNPDDWGIVPTNASQSAAIATWNAVIMDINANGYRLPTEAEWECMAKNKSNTPYTYAGSNNADEVAWHSGNSGGAVHEVGTKARIDRYGPYDMTGNLAEWCWDWYGNNPTMPAGPASGTNRVIRGGSYKEVARENTYRVGGKNPLTSSDTATEIGIRVLRTR